MSNISISSLNPTGFELFADDENFMADLNEQEFSSVNGGLIADFQELSPFTPGTPVVSVNLVNSPVQNISMVVSAHVYRV
jgi:hypothetical protein